MAAIAAETKIDCKRYYKFNNSALYFQNSNDNDGENFDKMFWKWCFICFKCFFTDFIRTEGVSLHLTIEVLKERRQLEITVQSLQKQITAGVAKLEELRQEQIILQQQEAKIPANKDFNYAVLVTKQRKLDLPTGHYVTNCSCLFCNFTCNEDAVFAN